MLLDFTKQISSTIVRIQEVSQKYARAHANIEDAILYVNSDIASILRYQMYIVTFPSYALNAFQISLNNAVHERDGPTSQRHFQ
jgi:hypothetical protein